MNPSRKNIMIGTAGHVDHGKTALVKLLTGCDTDTLDEEKARGLTIDLGFAPCQLRDKRVVGIVDVPGHSDFIRNMVAGAHGIDLVMLVVAADDGIMPQTQEHLHILTLMGLRHGIVALTKVDIVDAARRTEVTAGLRNLLAGTFLESAPICPVSSITGEGFDNFYDQLNATAETCNARPAHGLFRMWVEDVFTIRGAGTIVTGIPSLGRVQLGESVVLAPGNMNGHVRRIQVYGNEDREGRAGECVALNIPELDHKEVRRGLVLGHPDAVQPSTTVEAELRILNSARSCLKDYTEAQFHIGTAAVACNVALLQSSEMPPGSSQMVQLRLQGELPVAPGERFVLRGTFGPGGTMATLGGGQVLGACNTRLRRRRESTIQMLERRKKAIEGPATWLETMLRESAAPMAADSVRRSCFLSNPEFTTLADDLVNSGRIFRTKSGRLVHDELVRRTSDLIVQKIGDTLRQNPQRAGVTAEELLSAEKIDAELLQMASDLALSGNRLHMVGQVYAPPGWQPQVSQKEADSFQGLDQAFRRSGWAPPSIAELALELRLPEPKVAQAARLLQERGALVRLDDKVLMHKQAVEAAKDKVLELFRHRSMFTTMEFRDALGVSRKFAVPLLDYMDRIRFTVRTGHDRTPGAEAKRILASATPIGGRSQ